MEIAYIENGSIKIKTKEAIIIVDPVVKAVGSAVLLTGQLRGDPKKVEGLRLTIKGPGEYEVSGTNILGKRLDSALFFEIFDEINRILLIPSSILSSLKEEIEDYDCVVVRVVGELDLGVISNLSQNTLVFFGEQGLPIPPLGETASRVNLKKKEESRRLIFLGTE